MLFTRLGRRSLLLLFGYRPLLLLTKIIFVMVTATFGRRWLARVKFT